MTEVEQPPQNGIDLSAAEDDENNKARPADIEQDMREMERRKRVEAIMGSKLFREELERIVDSAREGGASGILQQLSDIVGVPVTRVGNVFKTSNCMVPINDIRGVESMGYAKGEKILRCKLAATFRLLDLYGWTQGLGAQISARLKVDQEYFLVNPYGLLYHELTASSLNKVDMQGNIVEQGTTNFGVNKSHFVLHSVVHAARPDIRCAIYIGCSPVVAISSLKTGLLPLTKDACVLGEITSYAYTGVLDEEERNKLVRNLGPNSKVILLANHGALCCGETIEEAFFAACHIVQACETQLKLLPVGVDNLVLIPEESRKIIYEQARRPPEDLEKKFAAALATTEAAAAAESKDGETATTTKVAGQTPKWRVGGAEFEALMRMLDNAGYRTGYIYRHPLIKSEPPRPKNDVELPPAVSSLGYLLEEEELFRQGIWKKGDIRKGGDRSRWLNSPNVYQKVEVLETGTPDPKKITKWVAEGSPTHSTPVRIEDPLQFVPAGTTTKEFKRLQQQIKDNRRADKISAGPQSHILEGVTWDEANRIKDATVSQTGDHVVLMGAASKGIIQRGFQHNATVYKAPYAKNPFDNVTDDELNEYKRTVERKKKSIHGEYTDTDFSESEALSSLQTSGAQQTKQTTTTTTAAVSQSEPETSEHQVLRIETKQAPVPSQAEVVLSDATLSFINGERSHTATNRKPPTGREIENDDEDEDEDQDQDQENSVVETRIKNRSNDDEKSSKSCGFLHSKLSPSMARKPPKCRRELLPTEKHDDDFQGPREKLELPSVVVNKSSKNSNDDDTSNVVVKGQRHDGNGGLGLFSKENSKGGDDSEYCYIYFHKKEQQDGGLGKPQFKAGSGKCHHLDEFAPNVVASASTNKSLPHIYDKPRILDNASSLLFNSSMLCCKPNICGGVRQALHKPLRTENNLICNIPFTSLVPQSAATNHFSYDGSTSPSTNDSSPRRHPKRRPLSVASDNSVYGTGTNIPYRTTSHFGFNSPRHPPRRDHKHVPIFPKKNPNQLSRQLGRAISYEEIFATPRYEELCTNCFGKLLQMKPGLAALSILGPETQEEIQLNKYQQSQYYEYINEIPNIEISEVMPSQGDTALAGAVSESQFTKLAPLPEVEDENDVTLKEEDADLQNIEKSKTFLAKIDQFNFSQESVNPNYVAEPGSSISSDFSLEHSRSRVRNLSIFSASTSAPTSATSIGGDIRETVNTERPTNTTITSVTELWNFGQWQNRPKDYNERDFLQPGPQSLKERRVVLEIDQHFDSLTTATTPNKNELSESVRRSQSLPSISRVLMTRDDRFRRKLEFQELWEDHISFFRGKEQFDEELNVVEQHYLKNNDDDDDNDDGGLVIDNSGKEKKTNELNRDDCVLKESIFKDEEQATNDTTTNPGTGNLNENNNNNNDEGSLHIDTGSSVYQLISDFENNISLASGNINSLIEFVAQQNEIEIPDHVDDNNEGKDEGDLDVSMVTIQNIDDNDDDNAIHDNLNKAMDVDNATDADVNDDDDDDDTLNKSLDGEKTSKSKNEDKDNDSSFKSSDRYYTPNDIMDVSYSSDVEEKCHQKERGKLNHYVTIENLTQPLDRDILAKSKSITPITTDESISLSFSDSFASLNISPEQLAQAIEGDIDSDILMEYLPSNKNLDVVQETESATTTTTSSDLAKFSTVERKILKKIEQHQLKNSGEIFDKIDHTIRNKLTPSRLEWLIHQQQENPTNNVEEECFHTWTRIYQQENTTSTPHRFNFGNEFDKTKTHSRSITDNELMSDIEDEFGNVNETDQSLSSSEYNKTEPCCSKNFKSSKYYRARLSHSLSPKKRSMNTKISSSSGGSSSGIICKTFKTRSSLKSKACPSDRKKQRNFILENIRNAGKTKLKHQQLTTTTTPTGTHIKRTPTTKTSRHRKEVNEEDDDDDSQSNSICSFESKVVAGSPRLWLSVPRLPQYQKQRRNAQPKNREQSSPILKTMSAKRQEPKRGFGSNTQVSSKRQRIDSPQKSIKKSTSEKFSKNQPSMKKCIRKNLDGDLKNLTEEKKKVKSTTFIMPINKRFHMGGSPRSMKHHEKTMHSGNNQEVESTKLSPSSTSLSSSSSHSLKNILSTMNLDKAVEEEEEINVEKNGEEHFTITHMKSQTVASHMYSSDSSSGYSLARRYGKMNILEETSSATSQEREEVENEVEAFKDLVIATVDSPRQAEEIVSDSKSSIRKFIMHGNDVSQANEFEEPSCDGANSDREIPLNLENDLAMNVADMNDLTDVHIVEDVNNLLDNLHLNEQSLVPEEGSSNNDEMDQLIPGLNVEDMVPYPLQDPNIASMSTTTVSGTAGDGNEKPVISSSDDDVAGIKEEVAMALSPRLRNLKSKISDLGEHVAKCSQQIDECVAEQVELEQNQQQWHENVALNQYAEEISCKANTYSLSETED